MPRGFKRRSNNNPTTLYYQNKRSTKIQAEVKSTFEPDQKRRAVAAFKRGDKKAVISGVVGCSTRSLYNWAQNIYQDTSEPFVQFPWLWSWHC